MTELREFAQHSDELDKLGIRLIPISVDDHQHAHDVWEKAAGKKFTVLSDPGAKVIRQYGLLHQAGHADTDIALRTTLLIGADGREKWRRVSQSVPDIPNWEETLGMIKKSQGQ
jgi:peroxiredoxin